ncbi:MULTISPECIES: hypothetical protein [unclassified Beijerinckia]|uniref:hypothetical protein n=1 Tax=unclassified Beijerinckia TaxID=2638183 RepID=UPI000B8497F2|nr:MULTISPECIES: hypothetical protein [unclassified Beijerinckia]MDH7797603.1 hypothetical protein [Beijerinckia sp. GAS462]
MPPDVRGQHASSRDDEPLAFADRGCEPFSGCAWRFAIAILTLIVCSLFYFSSPLTLFGIFFLPNWYVLIPILVGVIATVMVSMWIKSRWAAFISAAIFALVIVPLSMFVLDKVKERAIVQLQPEAVISHSFAESADRLFWVDMYFVHAAVLKNCKVYSWSYRQMAFFELKTNVARNVVPVKWGTNCHWWRQEPSTAKRDNVPPETSYSVP